jgi:hypothetical protein
MTSRRVPVKTSTPPRPARSAVGLAYEPVSDAKTLLVIAIIDAAHALGVVIMNEVAPV